jgi:hypothetical protein
VIRRERGKKGNMVLRKLALALLVVVPSVATPAPLTSVWLLQPDNEGGQVSATFGKPFLTQRFVPLRLVRITAAAEWAPGKNLADGTFLHRVFQGDGQYAWCTFKDRSMGNIAKSLFIPALDRRPCFLDRDADGRFDDVFAVFDKYGSAFTPSGNITSAKPLAASIPYTAVESSQSPKTYRLSLFLTGSKVAEKARIGANFASDDTPGGELVVRNERDGKIVKALNLAVDIQSVTGNDAVLNVKIDREPLLLGDSGGRFYSAKLTDLPKGWEK